MKAALVLCPLWPLAVVSTVVAQQKTLLMTLTEDVRSLDATTTTLGRIDKYDVAGVTPDAGGATMFSLVPTAGISVLVGDPDADGIVAEFHKDATGRNWGHAGCFLRNADRDKGDPRRLFWTVQDDGTSSNPVFLVFVNGGNQTHKVRQGDFVRIGENGSAEFFVKQEQIMKAAGTQTGAFTPGASDICQDAGGGIYYSPPYGGHYVSDGSKQVLAMDGAIVWIPASAITYDARGNVQDVTAGSARLVVEMGTNTPSQHPTIVRMVSNSLAVDRDGNGMALTLSNWPTNLSGLAIDPNGGTFTSSLTGTQQHPHLVFAFDNPYYRGTIFSTRPYQSALGSIARINGVDMGTQVNKANGSWLGAVGQGDTPTIHGLEVVDWRLKPKAPWGVSLLNTPSRGGVVVGVDPQLILDFQGLTPFGVIWLTLGIGPARGRFLLAADLSAQFDAFASVFTLNVGPFLASHGPTDPQGRFALRVPIPNDPGLKGLALIWQCLYINRSPIRPSLSNPAVTEFR